MLIQETDPNLLVTTWAYDGFGRLALEKQPDGTQTAISLSRSKDGGAYSLGAVNEGAPHPRRNE